MVDKRKRDLTGEKFNKVLVTGFSHKTNKFTYWNCLCDCGNTTVCRFGQMTSGEKKSCGCFQKEKARRTIKRFGKKALPNNQAEKNSLFLSYKRGATKRKLEFSLTKEKFLSIVQDNCYYCDKIPSQIVPDKRIRKGFVYNGIDRINNLEGYTETNSVACCKRCNVAKSVLSEKEFLEMVRNIHAKHFSRRNNPVDDAMGNAEALLKMFSRGIKIPLK